MSNHAAVMAATTTVYTLDVHKGIIGRLEDGRLTVDEYRQGFYDLNEYKDSVMAQLNKLTIEELDNLHYSPFRRRDVKKKMVQRAFDDMQTDYLISGGYSVEGLGNWEEKRYQSILKQIEAVTQDDLKAYAEKVAAQRAKREAQYREALEAVKDPQTLEDFQLFLKIKKREDMTPEQKLRYDRVFADHQREVIASRAENQATVKAAGQTTGARIVETKHTKKGYDLFVVQAAERVEREVYNAWNAAAKKLGGWYSSYRAGGAVPGFQFTTREAAEAFLAVVTEGDTKKATELSKARRDAFADDKSQSARERLLEMADALEARATDSLNQDRQANTARRARHAAAAEASARSDIALARTMRNIAEGPTKYLDHVRTKAQVEMLYLLMGQAKRNQATALAKEGGEYSYRRYTEEMEKAPDERTPEYAEWPAYEGFRSDWAALARELAERDGAKQVGKALLKIADDQTQAYTAFVKAHQDRMLLVTNTGQPAVFPSQAAAEAVRQRSPHSRELTVVALKRGQNAVVWSPRAAKERGLWDGEEDLRVTVPPALAEEALAKAKQLGLRYPWHWDHLRETRARLKAMWVETPAGLRAALREFIALQGEVPKADRIKELERALAGRRDIGVDFFPTPAWLAAELVERAGIEEGMSVLEPSAGNGNIADAIRAAGFEPDVCEMSSTLREILEAKGYNLVGHDFLGSGVFGDMKGYDRIIMNPPFSDKRDITHVRHAYNLLNPGGRIVAIMCEGSFYRSDKTTAEFQEWLESLGADVEKLPAGTFLDPSLPNTTGVNARVVVINKPA